MEFSDLKDKISAWWAFPCCACLLPLLIIIILVAALAATWSKSIGEESPATTGCQGGCHIEAPDISKATSKTEKMFSITAYYRPLPGQKKYETGSYAKEIRMEGKGESTASGIRPEWGSLAAPKSYKFGTVIDLPGYGRGVVLDRGCAIQKAGVPDTCSFVNVVTKYDHLDLFVGEGDEGREKMKSWNGKELKGTMYLFGNKTWSQLKQEVKTVCNGSNCPTGQILGKADASGYTCPLLKPGVWVSDGYNACHRTGRCADLNKGSGEDDFGEKIVAVRGGKVVYVWDQFPNHCASLYCRTKTHGNAVKILQDDGTTTNYGHIKQYSAQQHGISYGVFVKTGQVIAEVDDVGHSSASHLHIQMNNRTGVRDFMRQLCR